MSSTVDNVFDASEIDGVGTVQLLRRVPDFLLGSAICDLPSISHESDVTTVKLPIGRGRVEIAHFDGPLEGEYVGADHFYDSYVEAKEDNYAKGVFTVLGDFYATLHVTYWAWSKLLTIQGATRDPVSGAERHVWVTVGMDDRTSRLDPNTLKMVPAISDTLYMGIRFEGPAHERLSASVFKRFPYRIDPE